MTAEADGMTGADGDVAAVCWDCGGPCSTYKGSVHGWRCRDCIERYLDEAAAKADAYEHWNRQRRIAKGSKDNWSSYVSVDEGRRRDGGMAMGLAVPTSAYAESGHQDDRHQRGRP